MAYNQFAYHYDKLMADMPYAQWLDFLQQCWKQHGQPMTIADLGCGTGSIAIPLACQGYEVFGIDLSEDMLTIAQQKAQQAERQHPFQGKGRVTWLQQDLRDWSLPVQVDAVISVCDCLNYLLEEEDVQQAFRQAFDGLHAGGIFIFDTHTPHQLVTYAQEQPFFLNEADIAYIWTSELDEKRCEIEHALTIFSQVTNSKDNSGSAQGNICFQRLETHHVQRAYPVSWLKQQLLTVGFHEVACYGDFLWEPAAEATQRAFFVARK